MKPFFIALCVALGLPLSDVEIPKRPSVSPILIGSGFTSPYKMVASRFDSGQLLVINGGGESGGPGYLNAVDAMTLKPVRVPLTFGSNLSDIAWVGQRVLVASRGSDEIFLVDPQQWTLLDRSPTVSKPISIAVLPDDLAAVVGVEGSLAIISTKGGVIKEIRRINLSGRSYKVVAAGDGRHVFVSLVTGVVLELNISDLTESRRFLPGGELSFGGVTWNQRLLFTDRDGYIVAVDPMRGETRRIDLSISVGVPRRDLPLRGIEPMDLIPLKSDRLLVINNRQESVILSSDETGWPEVSSKMRLPSGAYGVYLPNRDELLITHPSNDTVIRVQKLLSGRTIGNQVIRTGTSISRAMRLEGEAGSILAVLDSAGVMRLVDERTGQTRTLELPRGMAWGGSLPVEPGPEGSLVAVVYAKEGFRLVQVAQDGTIQLQRSITIAAPFQSMSVDGKRVMLIGRLKGEAELIDFALGTSTVIRLERIRPRKAAFFAKDSWVVIHDTNPDLGFTVKHGASTALFHRFKGSGWPSDILIKGKTALISGFRGSLGVFNLKSGQLVQSVAGLEDGLIKLIDNLDGRVWAVSANRGTVQLISVDSMKVLKTVRLPGVQSVLPAPESRGAWFVTQQALIWQGVNVQT